MSTASVLCRRIHVSGTVQGVGFRPFVYRLAERHALRGWVRNRAGGVEIQVEGPRAALDAFRLDLETEVPPLAHIATVTVAEAVSSGASSFDIRPSRVASEGALSVPWDAATCGCCLRELFDPADRRYRYPFINCTDCGPRFTIIRELPYDRERTTMACFAMCEACQREYDDPENRRFHAEANACPECGPRVALLGRAGEPHATSDAIVTAAALLRSGAVLAIKGLGGYHLAADARNEEAVARLRRRKRRSNKPLALMVADVEAARGLCITTGAEERLLLEPQRPIVLLDRRGPEELGRRGWSLAASVAPGQRSLGVMLPYTPLHHLLVAEFAVTDEIPTALVMTSANVSDEPIVYTEADALDRLCPIVDGLLIHDRPIQTRCEDSVVRCIGGRKVRLRRARGDTPQPISLAFTFPAPVLACGAHLKSTFCLGRGHEAFISPHIGDLEHYETLQAYTASIEHFQHLLQIQPEIVAHDLHPDYLATRYAQERGGTHLVSVQHHHAHIASVLAEHGIEELVIGVAFDGTGYGTDGCLWGAEFLITDRVDFERTGHLEYVPLPGADQAIRQPWRTAASYLYSSFGDDFLKLPLPLVRGMDRSTWIVLRQMMDRDLNSPLASSAGRLFDAIAALVTGRAQISYEGQAAIELEALVDADVEEGYQFELSEGPPLIVRTGSMIRRVVTDLQAGVAPGTIAARFHNGVAELVALVCCRLREQYGLSLVALSGGVFQNALLLEKTVARLRAADLEPYTNERVPPNDGGISLGQAAVAAARAGDSPCASVYRARSSRSWMTPTTSPAWMSQASGGA